jgi:hypothetical protein
MTPSDGEKEGSEPYKKNNINPSALKCPHLGAGGGFFSKDML